MLGEVLYEGKRSAFSKELESSIRGLTVKNGSISVLKLVIVPLVGKNEKTLLAPLEPLYKFHVCPPRLIFDATGFGVPSELYTAEMGPALKLASQIMISLTLEPPAVLEVKRS